MSAPLFFLCAGEASGDVHGANLMREIKARMPDARFIGVGGERMRSEGLDCLVRAEELAVVGLMEVLRRIPFYFACIRQLAREMRARGASVFIPIDFPDFNLRLCRAARAQGVRVVYYICPQVWAWRRGRIPQIEECVDLLLTIFPFEPRYFSKLRLTAVYVGHPLRDEVPLVEAEKPAPTAGAGVLAVLPGSRKSELQNHLPPLTAFLEDFLARNPGVRVRIPCAQTLDPVELRARIHGNLPSSLAQQIEVVAPGHSSEVLRAADAALVASGTSTLQTVLCNTPFAVFYHLHPLSWFIGRHLVKVRHVGLVNLIAEKEVCREFLQNEMTPENLARESAALLWNAPYRQAILNSFRLIQHRLGDAGASQRAAEAILRFLERGEQP